MSKNKFYAVRRGIRTGIFESWDEAKTCIEGYSGAEYRGFKTREEASAYLSGSSIGMANGASVEIPKPSDGEAIVYTDGSYIDGVVHIGVYLESKSSNKRFYASVDPSFYNNSANCTGELLAVMAGTQAAVSQGYPKITIIYDNLGIENWFTGTWKARSDIAKIYTSFMRDYIRKHGTAVRFIHVNGHSGVPGNQIADTLCRQAAGTRRFVNLDALLEGRLTVDSSTFQ